MTFRLFCFLALAAGGVAAITGIAAFCPSLDVYDRFVCTPGSACDRWTER